MTVNKRRFFLICSVFVLVILTFTYFLLAGAAYSLNVDGIEIGMVKNKMAVETAIQTLNQQLQEQNNSEISFTSEVEYTKARAADNVVLQGNALVETLKKNIKYSVQAASIYVDGNPAAALKSEEIAEAVLDEIQSIYLHGIDATKLKEAGFAEKVEIKTEFFEPSKVMEKGEAISFLAKGTNETKTHTVESGESFWTISRIYDMSLEDLIDANPNVDPERIKVGQTLNLILPKSLISLKTVEAIKAIEKAPFEQKLELSNSMYKDETRIKLKGEYGEKEVVADVTKINGIETGRIVLSETVIKEPKTQILIKGTKDPPPRKGTGTFSYPTRGSLTSRFGIRWDSQHEGIDIATPSGSPVKAADGGVVIWAAYNGGYGNLIKIDHGGGYISYYAHLSKYYVKVGQKVSKGQTIGAVGSTGNSTGPHVHFEIRKNGVVQDPLKYLK